jgi:predicted phage terminase large subunit-like protein
MGLEGWRPARIIAAEIPGAQTRVVEKEILLPGGGVIQFRSADNPDSLRGAGLDFVVVDEAAYIRGLRDMWEQALRPSMSDRKGKALFISTPKGIGNAFHEMWRDAQGDWAAFRFPTSANPHIDPEEIEAARLELGSLVFAQEYLGQFVELGGTLFRTDWERLCASEIRDRAAWWVCGERAVDSREGTRFVTVDLAASTKQTADYTVMAACQAVQGVLVVIEVIRRRLEGPDILPELRRLMSRHNIGIAHMESAGFQLSLVQQARREGLAVRELRADRDKIARALPLQARMEAGDVWFAEGPWLRELELELFGFPASEHDDQVDALAYAALVAGQTPKVKVGLDGLDGFGVRVSPNKGV